MKFHVYVPKYFESNFIEFKRLNKERTSRTICKLIKDYNSINRELHIPTIREIIKQNPDELRRLRELLDEFR